MFTKVSLRNFRSFDNITFDLSKRGAFSKNLAIVFGENGVGKSNLMSAFVLLKEIMQTMRVRDSYEEFLNQKAIFADESLEKALRQQIVSRIRDMQTIIDDYKMIGSEMPMSVEYSFNLSGNAGTYFAEFGESEIKHERLEFVLNQRKGVYFDCTDEKIYINKEIVNNRDLLFDIKESAKRFWGKHSMLAIVLHEIDDKSDSYGKESISQNFEKVFTFLSELSCRVSIGERRWNGLISSLPVFEDAVQGCVDRSEEEQLDIATEVFSQVFSAINSDYISLYYRRDYSEKTIVYQLYAKKLISGEIRDISFQKESTGNHQVLRIICFLLSACLGDTIVLDEADSEIHDLLFRKILQEILPFIKGQVIISTHNTLLMQSSFARDATYILKEEENGSKTVKCVSDYEKRIYLNNNIMVKYLNNEYGGLPRIKPINFEPLVNILLR